MRLKLVFSLLIATSSLVNAQQHKVYNGEYNKLLSSSYMGISDSQATYSYYENQDFERIYDGDFTCTFRVPVYIGEYVKGGSIKGQFKNGDYDGYWKLIYPFRFDSKSYLAVMDVTFSNGLINGPLKVVVTDASKNKVCETTIEFVNGQRSGNFNYYSKLNPNYIREAKGQYKNDNRDGRWTYVYEGNRGILDYEDGVLKDNFVILESTGTKTDGVDLTYGSFYYGDFSFSDIIHVLGKVNNNYDSKSWNFFGDEY